MKNLCKNDDWKYPNKKNTHRQPYLIDYTIINPKNQFNQQTTKKKTIKQIVYSLLNNSDKIKAPRNFLRK